MWSRMVPMLSFKMSTISFVEWPFTSSRRISSSRGVSGSRFSRAFTLAAIPGGKHVAPAATLRMPASSSSHSQDFGR